MKRIEPGATMFLQKGSNRLLTFPRKQERRILVRKHLEMIPKGNRTDFMQIPAGR